MTKDRYEKDLYHLNTMLSFTKRLIKPNGTDYLSVFMKSQENRIKLEILNLKEEFKKSKKKQLVRKQNKRGR